MTDECEQIKGEVIAAFDRRVRDLALDDYLELCEELESDFEARAECTREEIQNAEDDES